MAPRIVELENHLLSDGGRAVVYRLGRTYSFSRTYDSDEQGPDVTTGLTRDRAFTLLADTLQADVCEAY
jgi:hypothetical protein